MKEQSQQIQEAAEALFPIDRTSMGAEHCAKVSDLQDAFTTGAEYALSLSSEIKNQSFGNPEQLPYGYVFNHRFYTSLDELSGQTMSEGNVPEAVFREHG